MDVKLIEEVLLGLFLLVSLISLLLLLGTFLRSKFKIFQKLFLPASVIGGFIGLLLGPIVLKDHALLPIPDAWLKIAALMPGFLIVPVVASVPLGLNMKKDKTNKSKSQVLNMFLVLAIVGMSQSIVGHFVAGLFRKSYDLYPSFGTELLGGFSGGHGTAGVVGNILRLADQTYWELAQGITTTTATFGLVGGILFGILLINIAFRKQQTKVIKDFGAMPQDMVSGLVKEKENLKPSGFETTNSSSIDSISFHLALIMIVSGGAYGLVFLLKKYNVFLLSSIPQWAYAILLMYLVWFIMLKLKVDYLVDTKTKSKISSALTEFAVVAAIMSLPLKALFSYLIPLLLMIVLGFIVTISLTYFLSKKVFKDDYWFERAMPILGTNTGVFLTGILLLKMVDPDFESPVLKDYSISYSMHSVVGFVLMPITFSLLISHQYLLTWGFFLGVLALYFILLYFNNRKGVA